MGSTSVIGKCHCEPIEHFVDRQTTVDLKKKGFLYRIVTGDEK